MLSTTATIFLLISISLVFLAVGDVSFVAIQNALRSSSDNKILVLGLCFFLAGLFIKAGAVPFHGWLADAHSAAPSIVSVILSGIVVETMGVYPLIRVLMSLNLQGLSISISIRSIFMLVGTISIIVGALAAIGQSDFKRMLAYSTTSQVGYMLLGLGCGTSLGIAACAFHLFNHAIFKSLLFLNAGCVEHQVGTRDINKMGGLSKKMPITGIASLLSCLSIVGIPPLSGFWSKLLIIIALWVSGNYYFAYIAILASLLTLGYCLVLQRKAFFGQVASGLENVKEVGFGLALPAIILTVILVVVGIIAPFILNSYVLPVGNILK